MRAARLALATLILLAAAPASPGRAGHVEDFDREVPWGCAARDCIPAIDEPTFGDGSWLRPQDRVLGVVVASDARAYPVRILNWHEIVNDDVAGTPVTVTYCPLCGTGMTFERTIQGEATTFGVSGRLYKNDLVMYDRATESFWSQELGEAIWGPLHGETLRFVPTATTTWDEWRAAHPTTLVLARPDTHPEWRYDRYPYGDYETEARTLFPVENPSNALHPKAWVLGVFTQNESVAYLEEDVEREGAILDRLDGRGLSVTLVDGSPRAAWTDTPDAPRQVLGFWFAWHDFHPDTRLWGRLLAEVYAPQRDGDPARVVFSERVDRDAIRAALPQTVHATWLDERTLQLEGRGSVTLPSGPYGLEGATLAQDLHVNLDAPRPRAIPLPLLLAPAAIAIAAALLARRRRAS